MQKLLKKITRFENSFSFSFLFCFRDCISTLKESEILVYPNPTTGEVTIKFNVPLDGNVSLSFVDINGRVVTNILNEYMPSGNYTYRASLSGFAPGSYYTTMTSSTAISVNKTILISQ